MKEIELPASLYRKLQKAPLIVDSIVALSDDGSRTSLLAVEFLLRSKRRVFSQCFSFGIRQTSPERVTNESMRYAFIGYCYLGDLRDFRLEFDINRLSFFDFDADDPSKGLIVIQDVLIYGFRQRKGLRISIDLDNLVFQRQFYEIKRLLESGINENYV
jgi:hypothetical protein